MIVKGNFLKPVNKKNCLMNFVIFLNFLSIVKKKDYDIGGKKFHICAPVAQWIEQPPSKRSVGRSNRLGREFRATLLVQWAEFFKVKDCL